MGKFILLSLFLLLFIICVKYGHQKEALLESVFVSRPADNIVLTFIPFGFLIKKKIRLKKNMTVPKSFLVDINEDGDKKSYPITKLITTIGRIDSDNVDISFNRNTISTLHAQIIYKNQGFYIADLGSTNGTYLNDKEERISGEVRLRSGDIVIFDQYKFKFVVRNEVERGQKLAVPQKVPKTPVNPHKTEKPFENSDDENNEEIEQDSIIPEAFLIDINGATDKNLYKFSKRTTKIGRMRDNDIYINKSTVSALHAQIEYKNNEFYLTDNNSANGTYLNEGKQRITNTVCLKGEDIIYFDQYKFRFLIQNH